MNCDVCKVRARSRRATLDRPYHYGASGLGNVWLVGITTLTCERCGVTVPVLPRAAELHRVIARGLVEKPGALTGDELRFLRRSTGRMAKDFAALVCIDPATLSRMEAGAQAIGPATDKLARAVAATALDAKQVGRVLLGATTGERWERVVLRATNSGWRQARAA